MKTPQFKDIQFATYEQLNKWLKKHTFKVIILKDFGQDLQKIWLHKTGEILNTDFSSSIYIGKFLDMAKINESEPIRIFDNEANEYIPYHKLIVETIELT